MRSPFIVVVVVVALVGAQSYAPAAAPQQRPPPPPPRPPQSPPPPPPQMPGPFFGPIYVPPNYDVNYCSVHASFPIVGLKRTDSGSHSREHHRHGRYRRQAYGGSAASYDYTPVAPAPALSNPLYSPSKADHQGYGPVPRPGPSYAGPSYSGRYPAAPAAPVYRPPYGPGYEHHTRKRYYERHSCRFTATFSQETCQSCCRIASRNANTKAAEITGSIFVFDPDTKGDTMPDPESQCVCCAPKRV